MSKPSDDLEQQTQGEIPRADQVVAATAEEAADAVNAKRAELERAIRRDPLQSMAIAAGIGFVAALLLRRI